MRSLCVEDEEMQRIAREENLSVLHPEFRTKARVYYKNLERWSKVFIAGSLAGEIGGATECVEGARVTLEKDGVKIAEAASDPYGDFRFGGLGKASGSYRVSIADPRFAPKTLEVALGESAVLGTIVLEKAATG